MAFQEAACRPARLPMRCCDELRGSRGSTEIFARLIAGPGPVPGSAERANDHSQALSHARIDSVHRRDRAADDQGARTASHATGFIGNRPPAPSPAEYLSQEDCIERRIRKWKCTTICLHKPRSIFAAHASLEHL